MKEHFHAALRAAAQANPVSAFFIAGIDSYLGHDRDQRTSAAFREFAEKIALLENRLDANAMKREGYADIFSAVSETIDSTNHQVKIDAAVNILVNAGLKEGDPAKVDYSELEFFAAVVRSISNGALHCLGQIVKHDRAQSSRSLPRTDVQVFTRSNPVWHPDFVIGLFRELEQYNFVFLEFSNMTYNGKRSATVGTTDLGYKFHDHILELRRN